MMMNVESYSRCGNENWTKATEKDPRAGRNLQADLAALSLVLKIELEFEEPNNIEQIISTTIKIFKRRRNS